MPNKPPPDSEASLGDGPERFNPITGDPPQCPDPLWYSKLIAHLGQYCKHRPDGPHPDRIRAAAAKSDAWVLIYSYAWYWSLAHGADDGSAADWSIDAAEKSWAEIQLRLLPVSAGCPVSPDSDCPECLACFGFSLGLLRSLIVCNVIDAIRRSPHRDISSLAAAVKDRIPSGEPGPEAWLLDNQFHRQLLLHVCQHVLGLEARACQFPERARRGKLILGLAIALDRHALGQLDARLGRFESIGDARQMVAVLSISSAAMRGLLVCIYSLLRPAFLVAAFRKRPRTQVRQPDHDETVSTVHGLWSGGQCASHADRAILGSVRGFPPAEPHDLQAIRKRLNANYREGLVSLAEDGIEVFPFNVAREEEDDQ